MPNNLSNYLSSLTRTVSAGTRNGQPTRTVRVACTFPVAAEDVWSAVTDPDQLNRWFLPVTGEFAVGGNYQFEGNAGGTIEECTKPTLLSVTWEFAGEISWVIIRLQPAGSSTRFVLEHVAELDEVYWPTYGPGAAGVGWDSGLMSLAAHLTELELNPQDPQWLAANARELYTISSQAWAAADIDNGASEADANAAARRTLTFYLGEPAADDR